MYTRTWSVLPVRYKKIYMCLREIAVTRTNIAVTIPSLLCSGPNIFTVHRPVPELELYLTCDLTIGSPQRIKVTYAYILSGLFCYHFDIKEIIYVCSFFKGISPVHFTIYTPHTYTRSTYALESRLLVRPLPDITPSFSKHFAKRKLMCCCCSFI